MLIHSINRKGSRTARWLAIVFAISAPAVLNAQSSGNFTATVSNTQCVINTQPNGINDGSLNGGSPHQMLDTYIKTPNSQFTTLLITPSLVTGLFTNTAVTQSMESSAVSAAVRVAVTLDGNPVAPQASPMGIIYDQRFQQLSTNVFDRIVTCSVTNDCSIDLVESTLAAHSFNYVAPNVGGGNHHLQVNWTFECTDNTGANVPCTQIYTANTAGACAGPGTVTVTQVKNFSQDAPIVIGP